MYLYVSGTFRVAANKTTTENKTNKSRCQDKSRWADVSLSANATDLLRSHSSNKRRNASAPANTRAREEVTRMQQALLSARYHFLYRDEAPSAAHSVDSVDRSRWTRRSATKVL